MGARNAQFAALAVVVAVSAHNVLGQSITADTSVARVGDYVERYYTRAQSIVVDEDVAIHALASDLRTEGFPRRLTYETRLEWDPTATGDDDPVKVTRQLIAAYGRPPKRGEEPKCLDPRSATPEPLVFLLPEKRERFTFKPAGIGRIEGRAAMMIDYRSVKPEEPTMEWKDDCVRIELNGRARGRIWADPETAEILRLDDGITGMVDINVPSKKQREWATTYLTVERADTSIRYQRVQFTDPDETLLLPASINAITVIKGNGTQRTRIVHTFRNYRRFVTGSRIVQ
jgi:hypothetical protein